jgi:hypothetical protein
MRPPALFLGNVIRFVVARDVLAASGALGFVLFRRRRARV